MVFDDNEQFEGGAAEQFGIQNDFRALAGSITVYGRLHNQHNNLPFGGEGIVVWLPDIRINDFTPQVGGVFWSGTERQPVLIGFDTAGIRQRCKHQHQQYDRGNPQQYDAELVSAAVKQVASPEYTAGDAG